MGVRFGSPPAGAEEAAAAGLAEVAHGGMLKSSGGASLATTAEEQVSLVAPHEMRSLRLDTAAAHGGLEEAEHAGWRYLVQSAGIPVASAQLAPGAAETGGGVTGGGEAALSQVNEGPFVQATAAALEQAQSLPQVADGDYEPRMLTIPAIYVAALWLKDLSGDDDLVVPLAPAPSYLEAGRVYAEREFLDLVAGPAEERLAFDDSPQGTEGGSGG